MRTACLRFHERFVALKKEWYGAKGLLENSKYFVIEARLGEEVAQEGGLHDAYIDDLEVRVLSTTGGDANCSWVENPSKHNCISCIFKVLLLCLRVSCYRSRCLLFLCSVPSRELNPVILENFPWSCDFSDQDFCDFIHSSGPELVWQHRQGAAQREGTGPPSNGIRARGERKHTNVHVHV